MHIPSFMYYMLQLQTCFICILPVIKVSLVSASAILNNESIIRVLIKVQFIDVLSKMFTLIDFKTTVD